VRVSIASERTLLQCQSWNTSIKLPIGTISAIPHHTLFFF
jgi:hypothetical protein